MTHNTLLGIGTVFLILTPWVGPILLWPCLAIGSCAVTISIYRFRKVMAYWERCRIKCDELLAISKAKGEEDEFEEAEAYNRRLDRVLTVWKKSIRERKIPADPQLDDL